MSLENSTSQFVWQVKDWHEKKDKYFIEKEANVDYPEKDRYWVLDFLDTKF